MNLAMIRQLMAEGVERIHVSVPQTEPPIGPPAAATAVPDRAISQANLSTLCMIGPPGTPARHEMCRAHWCKCICHKNDTHEGQEFYGYGI